MKNNIRKYSLSSPVRGKSMVAPYKAKPQCGGHQNEQFNTHYYD